MNSLHRIGGVTVALLCLAGCATGPQQQVQPSEKTRDMVSREARVSSAATEASAVVEQAGGEQKGEATNAADGRPAGTPLLDVTPLTQFDDRDGTAGAGAYSDSYTRITISTNDVGTAGTAVSRVNLPYAHRSWVARWLWGTKVDINLSAKIKVGEYETTAPLITLSHQGDKDGEFWTRSVSHQLLNFPLFLVREDGEASIPEVRLVLKGTKDYASAMAGTALQAAVSAIQQVSPEASVLTKLTTQASKDKARAIDSTISKLFATGLTEEHVSHRDLLKATADEGGIAITLVLPDEEGDWDTNLKRVGMWRIGFAPPRPSIFSDWRDCKKDDEATRCANGRAAAVEKIHREITAGAVLNYGLVKSSNGLGSIRTWIVQQDWYLSAASTFNGTAAQDAKVADNLCKNIYNAVIGLGLNAVDATIVVWAVVNGLPTPPHMADGTYQSAPFCKTALDRVNERKS